MQQKVQLKRNIIILLCINHTHCLHIKQWQHTNLSQSLTSSHPHTTTPHPFVTFSLVPPARCRLTPRGEPLNCSALTKTCQTSSVSSNLRWVWPASESPASKELSSYVATKPAKKQTKHKKAMQNKPTFKKMQEA